ncbi:MAG: YafY family protein [Syntrophomonadaceae bacterium]
MQINRLFEMVYILLNKKTATAKQLADHFEVSTRTIYRDIETLSAAGIPIYTSKGKGGGIGLLGDFVLNKSVLSAREQNEILISLQSMQALTFPDIEPVLNKMSLLFNKAQTSWIEVDFSRWGSESAERNKFSLLKNAIINKQVISFDYFSSYGEKTSRPVEPLKLVFKSQGWYLYGFCRLKEKPRIFKISRIKNLLVGKETFARETPAETNELNTLPPPMIMVDITLKIDARMAYRVYDEFPEKDIRLSQDGSFLIEIALPEDEWICGYILSFGPYAQVLEPVHLRDKIAQRLRETSKHYL